MRIVVIANELQMKEWPLQPRNENVKWSNEMTRELLDEADAIVDLLFEHSPARLEILKRYANNIVIINSNLYTLEETDSHFVRINGWNTFLHGSILEASATNGSIRQKAEAVFHDLGKSAEWVADIVGFITPRIISSIINEAYFALSEGVSTKGQINTAMRLGTAYPYGPFEWAEKMGLKNINLLLQKLSSEDERYLPCELLIQEAGV